MPTPARVAAFVAMVEAGDYDEAVYAEDATVQENLSRILRGRTALVGNERAALTRNIIVAR
jgi:hypothetical protein